MVGGIKVVWSLTASAQFKELVEYIRLDSPQNAITVRKNILAAVRRLSNSPLSHAPDKLRMDNDERYRAFEIYRFRITYFVEEKMLSIIRIRSSWMEPFLY